MSNSILNCRLYLLLFDMFLLVNSERFKTIYMLILGNNSLNGGCLCSFETIEISTDVEQRKV